MMKSLIRKSGRQERSLMTLDINKLAHYADFNVTTASLGVIRCGPYTSDNLSTFDKLARADQADGELLARKLLLTIARRLTGDDAIDAVCGGPLLTEAEVAEITRNELDDFCNQFVTRRLRLDADKQTSDAATESKNAGCEKLTHAIIAHADAQRAQMEKILGHARSNILEQSAIEVALKAMRENSVVEQMRKYGLGETLADQMRKFGLGDTIAEKHRKDKLGISALDAALRTIKASDNLGESIATLRATEAASKHFAEPFESPVPHFSPPPSPSNPILETNRLLREQKTHAEEMRPTIIRAAELIQTLTDTSLATQALANNNSAQAERHAKRSMSVAIISIFLSGIVSCISIYYANSSPTAEQANQLAKMLASQMEAVTANAREDRKVFEKNTKDDRAAFAAAIAQQEAHIRELSKKIDNAASPRDAQQK